jgi:hypothetical protein
MPLGRPLAPPDSFFLVEARDSLSLCSLPLVTPKHLRQLLVNSGRPSRPAVPSLSLLHFVENFDLAR